MLKFVIQVPVRLKSKNDWVSPKITPVIGVCAVFFAFSMRFCRFLTKFSLWWWSPPGEREALTLSTGSGGSRGRSPLASTVYIFFSLHSISGVMWCCKHIHYTFSITKPYSQRRFSYRFTTGSLLFISIHKKNTVYRGPTIILAGGPPNP